MDFSSILKLFRLDTLVARDRWNDHKAAPPTRMWRLEQPGLKTGEQKLRDDATDESFGASSPADGVGFGHLLAGRHLDKYRHMYHDKWQRLWLLFNGLLATRWQVNVTLIAFFWRVRFSLIMSSSLMLCGSGRGSARYVSI